MSPGIKLLASYIMALRNLRHRGTINPDRHDDPDLLIIAPSPPTLKPQNFTPNHTPRLRHVVNDVIKHVS
jgi:hypothetical protein